MSSFSALEKRNSLLNKTQTPEFNKAKTDLLSLGIDLDDDLIQRLQTNLGIERIFSVARKAATLMKDKPHASIGGTPNIIYRNVAANSSAHGASLSPFKNMVNMDSKNSVSILKDLSNRSSAVEPQHRPAVDKLLESFGVMYARSPDRFVARMFGKKYKTTDKSDANSMSKLVLKARYVSEADFATMITRVDTTVNATISRSLFLLLSEEKSFALNKKRAVVDLWGFFTLLKTAAEQSRRSFDSKTSLLASDVEFWKKKNPPNRAPSSPGHKTAATDFTCWLDSTVGASDDLVTAENNRRFNFEANANHGTGDNHNHRSGVRSSAGNKTFSVAELIGNTRFHHLNDTTHGRQVMGNLLHEFENKCDVAQALHSPLKNHQKSQAHGRMNTAETFADFGHVSFSRDDFSLPAGNRRGQAFASSSSSQMGHIMGSTPAPGRPSSAARHSTQPHFDPQQEREGIFGVVRARPVSVGRSRHVFAQNGGVDSEVRQSVASALGFGIEDGNFPRKGAHFGETGGSREETARLQRINSFGKLSRDDRSASVASVMRGDRPEVSVPVREVPGAGAGGKQ